MLGECKDVITVGLNMRFFEVSCFEVVIIFEVFEDFGRLIQVGRLLC